MRWDYVTDYSSNLSSDIVDFSVSGDGKKVALLKSTNMTANGVELFNLAVLDFDTKQISNLVEKTPTLEMVTISPDGEWIAYIGDSFKRSIYAIPTDGSIKAIELGVCAQADMSTCDEGLNWSPNSNQLIWSDALGIWMATLPDGKTDHILENEIVVVDPKGEGQHIQVAFGSHQWSPADRFVLLQVIPSSSGVRWFAVLDTRSGKLHQVPGASKYSGEDVCAIWTADGSLVVAHSGDVDQEKNPHINTWKLVPTHNDLLLLEKTYELDSKLFSNLLETEDMQVNYFPDWLSQTSQDTFAFGITLINTDTSPILYELDPATGSLDEIIVIPYQTDNILWTPDGTGALVLGINGEIIFSPFDGRLMQELHLQLGKDAGHFIWLPPTPRS